MKRLFSILWKNEPKQMLLAILAGIITGVSNTAMVGLINKIIHVEGARPSWTIWLYIAMCFIMPLSLILAQYVLVTFSQTIVYNMRMRLVSDILDTPLRRLEDLGSNKLLASLTTDVVTISQSMSMIPTMIMQGTIVFTGLTYLFLLYWLAGIGVIVTMFATVFAYRLIQGAGLRSFYAARDSGDVLYKLFEALTMGTKELKLNHERGAEFVDVHLHDAATKALKHSRTGNIYYASGASMGRFVFYAAVGVLVFVVPLYIPAVTSEVLSGFVLVLMMLYGPLESVTAFLPIMANAAVSLQKIDAIGASLEEARVERRGSLEPMTSWKKLELQDVSLTYMVEREEKPFTLGPINLSFRPGELVFLVGGNGSGKTSLAKILLGLYSPAEGKLVVDGKTIDDQNRPAFRQLFSAVFVDFYLFESLLGINSPDLDQRASEYLKMLLLDHKVTIKDGRLSTTDLSQGQRKRLALLSAYLEDRPIYLFDEWAADQDPDFKRVFYRQLLPELKARGKTVIVISHDDAYFDVADRLIRLDYGKVYLDEKMSEDLLDSFARSHKAQPLTT